MADIINERLLLFLLRWFGRRWNRTESLVEIKFIQAFCSWEPAQWTNMIFPSEMKFMKIYSE